MLKKMPTLNGFCRRFLCKKPSSLSVGMAFKGLAVSHGDDGEGFSAGSEDRLDVL